MVTVVLTNTNTAEAAEIVSFVARGSQAMERRRTCSSVRFRTTTSNISPSTGLAVERATARSAAASGGTRWAGPAPSASEDPDYEIEDA